MSDIKDYDKDIEELFIRFLISDAELLVRCLGILDHTSFKDSTNSKTVEFITNYARQYSTIPALDQIYATTKKRLEKIESVELAKHVDWFLNEFEMFSRHRALERVILSSVDLLEQKRYGEVESAVKAAVQIGLVKDLGTDYFANPKERLEQIKNNSGIISTGWADIDKKLYGGFNKGEITIFAGQPGAGKSLFLQNLGVNWAQAGLNVIYITLELSEKLTSMRIDAMVSGYSTREVMKNIDDVDLRVRTWRKKNKGGALWLKYLPSGSTTNDIRSFIKELEIQTGIKADAVLVDYLDLCWPVSVKVSPSDQFIKDKYTSEELRNLAADVNVMMVTASQLNRSSFDEIEFDSSHIAGGISKVNTADNLIGIFVTNAMKEAGRYQVQFLKTRSSSGVGSKVDLAFDPATLRISDLLDGDDDATTAQTKNVINALKQKSVVNSNLPPAQPPAQANDVMGKVAAIRGMLNKRD